jgi:phosphoribosylglycinamide formyltransferase-1
MPRPSGKLKVAILASGRGSNLGALIAASALPGAPFCVAAAISDNPDVPALARAREAGIEAIAIQRQSFPSKAAFDAALADAAEKSGAGLICLAGFMRVLSPAFLSRFPGGVINVHPSLLPSFPGLDAQKQALEHGVKITGCTVHFVDDGVDTGPIILQAAVPVEPGDTVELLSSRILAQEHLIYTKAVKMIATGQIPFPHPGRQTKA